MPKRFVCHTKRPRPNYATAYMLWRFFEKANETVAKIESMHFDPHEDSWIVRYSTKGDLGCTELVDRKAVNRIRRG